MKQFQKELDEIKAPDALVMETMRKMHAANAAQNQKADEASDKHLSGASDARRKRMYRLIACAAAAVALFFGVGALVRQAADVQMAVVQADVESRGTFAASKGFGGSEESVLSSEEFQERTGIDFTSLVPGYSCTAAESVAFVNQAGTIVGDYGAYTYQSGAKRISIYASSSDQTAPAGLLNTEPKTVRSYEVSFGQSIDGRILYAAWVDGGTFICIRSDDLNQQELIRLVRAILA